MTDAAQSFDDLLFIQVGGTIDKDYPAGETNHGYEFEIGAGRVTRFAARPPNPPT